MAWQCVDRCSAPQQKKNATQKISASLLLVVRSAHYTLLCDVGTSAHKYATTLNATQKSKKKKDEKTTYIFNKWMMIMMCVSMPVAY